MNLCASFSPLSNLLSWGNRGSCHFVTPTSCDICIPEIIKVCLLGLGVTPPNPQLFTYLEKIVFLFLWREGVKVFASCCAWRNKEKNQRCWKLLNIWQLSFVFWSSKQKKSWGIPQVFITWDTQFSGRWLIPIRIRSFLPHPDK